jgi:hypothetical protein
MDKNDIQLNSLEDKDESETKIKKQKIEIKKRKKCKHPQCKKMISINEDKIQKITPLCTEHQKMVDKYEKPNECLICVEEFDKLNYLPLFPCCHWICKNCVIKTGKKECPVCRQPVILSSVDDKKCKKVLEKIMHEKQQQQLTEDRRIAENLQRQIMNEVNHLQQHRIPFNVDFEIEITPNNVQEIFEIVGALDPFEQRIYRQALERYEISRRNVRIGVIIANNNTDDEDDYEDDTNSDEDESE